MKKLKYVLFGGLLFMSLPQAFAVGDTQGKGAAHAGGSTEDFDDCYHCSILQSW